MLWDWGLLVVVSGQLEGLEISRVTQRWTSSTRSNVQMCWSERDSGEVAGGCFAVYVTLVHDREDSE